MDVLEVNLLGLFRIKSDAQNLADAIPEKARALLTYLALEGAQPRSILTALLWPYLPQDSAFDNLRKTIYRLRQRLQESIPNTADPLIADRQNVQLDPQRTVVDVLRFESLLAECDRHAHREVATCDECLARLTHAVELYQGELLAGFGLGDAPAFEEWLLLRRETLQYQALLALGQLATAWEARGDFERSYSYCSRALTLDPLREELHRQQMRLLVRLGRRHQALQQYESCRRLLREEMGIEPDAETVALFEQIRRGALPPPAAPLLATPLLATPPLAPADQPVTPVHAAATEVTNSPAWIEVPETGRVFGREAEMAQLRSWLGTERCQLVTILGIGGVGKTTLAAAVAHAVAAGFDKVIWRTLLNAPPLDELLRGVLLSIAQQPMANDPNFPAIGAGKLGNVVPASLDEQLTLLLNQLRQQRCLLVLDNLESILQPEGIGQMRPGYEGYTQLLRRLAENRHNSSLLLTSRERPQGLAGWEELSWVRSLRLEGLDATAGQALLTARGLESQGGDGNALVQRYSGNPLALKLVTETIQDLFEGDIEAFLASDALIFADIRVVLDEQFARLSDLEREILIWLAVEREAISVQTLRNNLLYAPTLQAVVEAVRSLQHRSLLEKSGAGVTLQNVIIEYTTVYLVEHVSREIEGNFERTEERNKWEAHGRAESTLASSVLFGSFLNRFALLKAQAKQYIRQSQARLILQPLAERLQQRIGMRALPSTLAAILERLRSESAQSPGYAGGNLFNLVRQLGFDLAECDFSRLNVWQADFRDLLFTPVNLAYADLSHSAFKFTFDLQTIKVSAGGQILVTGVVDGAVCLWRAAGGQLHHAFRSDDTNASLPIIISEDGQWLVSGGVDHTVRIWSAENGACLHTFAGHSASLHLLAMSRNRHLLASSSFDGTIRTWDVKRGEVRHVFNDHANGMGVMAFHPNGHILASGGERTIYLWDVESGQLLQTLNGHAREIECLAFSSDGRLLFSGAHDGVIYVWEIASGQCVRTLEGHSHIVRTLHVHSGGHLLASGGADRLALLWDLQTGERLHTLIGHGHEVKSLSFSSDGSMLASGGADNIVHIWDTQSGHALDSLKAQVDMVHSVRFDPTGNLLASSGADGLTWLWQLSQSEEFPQADGWRLQVMKVLQGHGGDIRSVAFHPNGRWLASGGGDHIIQLWDVESGESIRTLRGHANWVKTLAFSPDGRWLASGSADRTIRLWPMGDASAARGQGGLVLHGHDDDIDALAFSPDGRTLASGSLDHTARLWAIEEGRELHVLRGHRHTLSGVAYSTDGEFVVTSSYGYDTLVWDAHSGEPSERWRDHAVAAMAVTFHAKGELCACVTVAQTIEIRHAATGALLRRLPRHTNHIMSLAFNPAKPILVTSGWDSAIWLWNAETGACLDRLRPPGPYTGMNITGVTGITEAQKVSLMALGAHEQIGAGDVTDS
jgi:WD40 repeat protein/DNA-binding SARP family transcriptional activator